MARAFLSLGSNVGDRLSYLRLATAAVAQLPKTTIVTVSSIYETEPIGKKDQPDFLNAAIELKTGLSPRELFVMIKEVEVQLGRTTTERWGPREIDLDLLYYDSLIFDDVKLRIPHPEILKRRFVLIPLAEIAAGLIDPVHQRSIHDLLQTCPGTNLVTKTSFTLYEQFLGS